LSRSIERGRRKLFSLAQLFREAFEGYVVLNAFLEDFDNEARKVGEDWATSMRQLEIAGSGDHE
jgi:hypothetical protein